MSSSKALLALTLLFAVFAFGATQTINVTSYTDLGIDTSVTIDTAKHQVLSITVNNNSQDQVEYDIVDCTSNAVLQALVWNPGESSTKPFSPAVPYVLTTQTNRSGQNITVLTQPCWTEDAF